MKVFGAIASLLVLAAGIMMSPATASANPAPVIECANVGNGELCVHIWGDSLKPKTVRVAASYHKKTGAPVHVLLAVGTRSWQPNSQDAQEAGVVVDDRFERNPLSVGQLSQGYLDPAVAGIPGQCFKAVLVYQFADMPQSDYKVSPLACATTLV